MNKDFELKLFVYCASIMFGAIILFTKPRESRRPKMLLTLFLGYIVFQCMNMVEFFPLTAFQMFSFREDRAANYLKLVPVLEDGRIVQFPPHMVLPVLVDGRAKRYVEDALKDPQVAQEFAKAYADAYDEKFRQVDKPGIREIRFEQWKWHFMDDPFDPDHGFLVKRVIGKPRRPL